MLANSPRSANFILGYDGVIYSRSDNKRVISSPQLVEIIREQENIGFK